MERFTTVDIPTHYPPINHTSRVLLLGSCFSEHIGKYFAQAKITTLNNPFGITFNPLSIAEQLHLLLSEETFPVAPLQKNGELYYHFSFHGAFNHTNEQVAIQHMQNEVEKARRYLKEATHLFLTPGTAFVWFYNVLPVNNCHKLPKSLFKHRRISVATIYETWQKILVALTQTYPNLSIITTVSPVRHTHAGFVENNRSKAALISAIDQLQATFPSLDYFPSYEIILDELRDYRYFDNDMVHPNALATRIVCEAVQQAFFSAETQALQKRIKEIQQAVAHRPLFPATQSHRQFLEKTLQKLQLLKDQFPAISFEEEVNQLQLQLTAIEKEFDF
ncbi:MAG: GSCFA domain-containing protein [Schleiferiaceae bacterium]|nr:GSCFA domain-containing protein [Schleiferiaceae bacterium]